MKMKVPDILDTASELGLGLATKMKAGSEEQAAVLVVAGFAAVLSELTRSRDVSPEDLRAMVKASPVDLQEVNERMKARLDAHESKMKEGSGQTE